METFKQWVIEVGLQKGGPSAIRGAVLGLIAWLISKSSLLVAYGITTVGHTTTIDWDKLSMWLIAGLPAVTAMLIKVFQHTGTKIITKGEEQK